MTLINFLTENGKFNEHANRSEYSPKVSQEVDVRVLAASTAEEHDIPAGAKFIIFTANTTDFYVRFGVTTVTAAAVPSADITDGTGCLHSPGARYLETEVPGTFYDKISIIAPVACIVTMEFYD